MAYTEKDKENDLIVGLCYDHLDDFNFIYGPDGKEMPNDKRVTVYCVHGDDTGFAINVLEEDMGIELFTAKKWIYHEELEEICGRKIDL